MPGDFMSIRRKLMPSCCFGIVVGADEEEAPVGMLRQRRPGLLAIDDIIVAIVARALVRRLARSEPAPGSE